MIDLQDKKIQKYLTPYKYPEPVLMGSGVLGAFDSHSVDIPFVFRHKKCFYMLYTGYDGIGYQSALAVSDDLIHWKHKGMVLERELESSRWDRVGGAATWMLKESDDFSQVPRLGKYKGKYWMLYHSYPQEGYEEGPAEIGLAWSTDEELLEWNRLDKPVFSWKDGAEWEQGGLYKACIVRKDDEFILFYNAKNKEERWIEQTGMATSIDLHSFCRRKENPILKVNKDGWDERFVSDPYVLRDEEHWVNFYFGYGQGHACEGLAISKDLIQWEKVEKPILRNGEEGDIDCTHAHKAAIIFWNGVLYHFYCGTRPWKQGDRTKVYEEFRTICVAADKPFVS